MTVTATKSIKRIQSRIFDLQMDLNFYWLWATVELDLAVNLICSRNTIQSANDFEIFKLR